MFFFGIYTLVIRIKSPDKFSKLDSIKEKLGDNMGYAMHTFLYSIVPIFFGGSFYFFWDNRNISSKIFF